MALVNLLLSVFLSVLYALLVFLVFLLIPFMYFYFEEKDDDVTVRQVRIKATGCVS